MTPWTRRLARARVAELERQASRRRWALRVLVALLLLPVVVYAVAKVARLAWGAS